MPTILLVEDNPSNAALLEDVFRYDRIPAQLVTVSNGEDALQAAITLQPVLILMDLRLPGIDGLEATEVLKHYPLTYEIPIWAITAYAMSGDKEKALESGCDDYFAKPFSMRMLADRLRDFLQDLEKAECIDFVSAQSSVP
jgi:two-component system, cell cycle response regulator DivK